MPASKAPPPAKTSPRLITSAASSGGVLSNVIFIASIILFTESSIITLTCCEVTPVDRGKPVLLSRPPTSPAISCSSGQAEPSWILTSSAVFSPISRPKSRLKPKMTLLLISSPPMRTELAVTNPPSEITATSVVPPPMSTIIFALGS